MKYILPKGMIPGAVIEHPIQHDPQPGFMQGLHQLAKVLFIPQKGINLGIVRRIKAMVGGALKDRVQIDPLYAQVFQIGYFPGNSFHRSAEEIVSRWSKRHRVSFSCEAVGEDLIPYEVLCPVRCTVVLPFKHIGNHKGTNLRLRQFVCYTQLGEHERYPVVQGDHKKQLFLFFGEIVCQCISSFYYFIQGLRVLAISLEAAVAWANIAEIEIFQYRQHADMSFRQDGLFLCPQPVEKSEIIPAKPLKEIRQMSGGDSFDLGGLHIDIYDLPGHTRGSLVMLIREERALLLGDACNYLTILHEPYSTTVREYKTNLEALRPKVAGKYDRVYLSHGPGGGSVELIDGVGNVIYNKERIF